jgi:hypothetical protein
MDISGRSPGAIAKVPGMPGGLHYDWDRNRAFDVNRGVFANVACGPVRNVAPIPGDQIGVALSPIWRRAMKLRFGLINKKNRGQNIFFVLYFFVGRLGLG